MSMKDSFKVKEIAKRKPDGGITLLNPSGDCDICEGISKGKYITHVVQFTSYGGMIDVCKTCLDNAINEINKKILED